MAAAGGNGQTPLRAGLPVQAFGVLVNRRAFQVRAAPFLAEPLLPFRPSPSRIAVAGVHQTGVPAKGEERGAAGGAVSDRPLEARR